MVGLAGAFSTLRATIGLFTPVGYYCHSNMQKQKKRPEPQMGRCSLLKAYSLSISWPWVDSALQFLFVLFVSRVLRPLTALRTGEFWPDHFYLNHQHCLDKQNVHHHHHTQVHQEGGLVHLGLESGGKKSEHSGGGWGMPLNPSFWARWGVHYCNAIAYMNPQHKTQLVRLKGEIGSL